MTMLLSLNAILSSHHHHQLTTRNQPRSNHANNDNKLLDEDDTSTSSTIPVDQPKKVAGMHQDISGPTSSASGRKAVRFSLDRNVAHESLFAGKDEAAESWYSDADYQRFRRESHDIAREAASADRKNGSRYSYAQVVLRTYRACCSYYEHQQRNRQHVGDDGDDSDDSNHSRVLNPAQRRVLERTLEASTDRLGLELKSMRHLRKEVRDRRTDLYDFVLDLQAIPVVRGDPHRRAEYIRRGCECVSLPSRIFAQTMAQARLACARSSTTTPSGSTHDDDDEAAELSVARIRAQEA